MRDVRSPTEVFPNDRVIAAEIVIDREFTRADLNRRSVARPIALADLVAARTGFVGNQFQLVRLGGQLVPRLLIRDGSPTKALPFLDDLGHQHVRAPEDLQE